MTALISGVGGSDDDVDGDDGDEAEWYDDECEIEAGIWGFSESGSREEKRCGIVMDGHFQGCFEVFTAMKMVIII